MKEKDMSFEMAEKLVTQVNKARKEESMILMSDPKTPITVDDVLSTGLPNLDRIISCSVDGKWGLPVGRIVGIKSKPSVGKTSFVLGVAREAQKRGGLVHIIESEHALDLEYIRKLKCDPEGFMISQPDVLEEAFEIIENAVELCEKLRNKYDNQSPFLIIMDSFSGFQTESEMGSGYGSGGGLAEHARVASRACRKLTGPIKKAKALLLVIHQVKSKIGVRWGNPETHIGGDAFRFHDSVEVSLYRTTSVKFKSQIVGHHGVARTTKNKLFPPFREAKFRIINGRGFDRNFSILEFLLNEKEIKRKGGWFLFKRHPEIQWQGSANFNSFLKEEKKARILVQKILSEKI